MNIYVCFYVNTARDVVTVLLIFVDIHHLICPFSRAHTDAHTHKQTYMISTQEEWRQPGKFFVRDKG